MRLRKNLSGSVMKKTIIIVLLSLPFMAAVHAQGFLADKHAGNGIACNGCHAENPPAKAVSTERCVQCHGDLQKVGKLYKKKDLPNPHINHNEELYCEDCHKGHTTPVNYCAQCHQDMRYVIP